MDPEDEIYMEAIQKSGERIIRAISACEKKYGGGITVMALRGVVCSHFMALEGTGLCADSEIASLFDEFARDIRSDIVGMTNENKEALH